MPPGDISIGELAKEVGVSTATINFYVKEGVLPPPRRLNRTRAAYSARHARLIRLIKSMQAAGFSLAHVKGAFARYGTDERGLREIEGIGVFQAPPLLRVDASGEALEPFEPVGLAELAGRAGVDADFVRRLERWSVLRPVHPGRYDVRDLWVLRAMKSLVEAGVPVARLRFLNGLIPVADEAAGVIHALTVHHRKKLQTRELRFRDLLQPLLAVLHYALVRAHAARYPEWRGQVLDVPARRGRRTSTTRPRARAAARSARATRSSRG